MKHLTLKRIACAYIAAGLLASMAAAQATAHAHDTEKPYSMTVIVDAAQGRKVRHGDYETAIAWLTSPKVRSHSDQFARHTNLCVAYLKTGALELAEEACESAIAVIADRDQIPPYYAFDPDVADDALRNYRAMAFSNRGVVNAIKGDADAALADFEMARSLDKRLRTAKSNLERLERGYAAG